MFFVGGAPVPLVRELLASGDAVAIPISGAGRNRLLKLLPGVKRDTIPAGVYPNTGRIDTVSVRAIWIVNDSVPDATIYAILEAFFNPENRAALAGSHRSAQFIRLDTAAADLPLPLHPGARRFYLDMGKLPKAEPQKRAPARLGKT
jgi:TRAP transporter TAXI family solute receptor